MEKNSTVVDDPSFEEKYPLPLGLLMRDKGNLPTRGRVKICKEWILENLVHSSRFEYAHSSYWYKHRVEEEAGVYIANQDFIVAAWELKEFEMKTRDGSVNFILKAQLSSQAKARIRERRDDV